jgi:hypothetical protein
MSKLIKETNMQNRVLIFLTFIFLNISIIFIPNLNLSTLAQTNKGLIIVPAIQNIDAEKGRIYNLSLTLENDTNADQNINMLTQTFKAGSEEGAPELKDFEQNDIHKNWIEYVIPNFTIKAKEKKIIPYNLNIVDVAEEKSYYFALIFNVNNQSNQENNQTNKVRINQRIAGLLFVNVGGQNNQKIEINQNFITSSSLKINGIEIVDSLFDDLRLEYQLKNKGTKYIQPEGNIFFLSGDEKIIEKYDINPENRIIINDTKRSFGYFIDSKFNLPFSKNIEKDSLIQVDNVFPIFGMNKFDLRVNYVNENKELKTENLMKSIIFIPYKLILTILITCVIIAGIFYLYKNKTITKLIK